VTRKADSRFFVVTISSFFVNQRLLVTGMKTEAEHLRVPKKRNPRITLPKCGIPRNPPKSTSAN